jgi:hypothetical protein
VNALTEQLADLTQAHADFLKIAYQLEPQKREQPGVCGEWSPKDVVAHLVGWDRLLLEFIADTDSFVPPTDADQFNQQSVYARQDLGWSDVMQEMAAIFYDLQQAVATVNAYMQIYDRVLSWLAGRTEDYRLHRGQLAEWVV